MEKYLSYAKKATNFALDIPSRIGARNTLFLGLSGVAFISWYLYSQYVGFWSPHSPTSKPTIT